MLLENKGNVGQLLSELDFEVSSAVQSSSVQVSYLSEPLANPGESVQLKLVALAMGGTPYRGSFSLIFSFRNRHTPAGYERMEVDFPAHR